MLDNYKEVNNIAIIFVGLWVGLTVPIALHVIFTILKPIVIADHTGISMVIIGLLVALVDGYIGIRMYEKMIGPWLEKRKKKRHFP
ncbi:hypothetical protein AB3N04_05745 [Alkalihalophilus sp. As8PL]|uniref:Uncharacterized protein n=1 Tax=Alkalihalophilus sp. As8PL TaxID=3237103 RepID=A0AB39BVJ3_9BACI